VAGIGLLQLIEIDSDQGSAIVGVRARQAVALDDGARAIGRDVEASADLRVGELFKHRLGHQADTRLRVGWLIGG